MINVMFKETKFSSRHFKVKYLIMRHVYRLNACQKNLPAEWSYWIRTEITENLAMNVNAFGLFHTYDMLHD